MKIGILGTGFGKMHAEWLSSLHEITEIVIWGRNENKLLELTENPKITTTLNMDDIFDDKEIELIDICLPNDLHKEMTIRSLLSGKNVFCEVPVALSMKDALEMKNIAQTTHKLMMGDSFMRFAYANVLLKTAIEDERYGKLQSLKIWRLTPPWWGKLGRKEMVANLLVHDIDYITWLLGCPKDVKVNSSFINEGKGIMDIIMNYGDKNVILTGSSMMPNKFSFHTGYDAVFEKAVLHCETEEQKLRIVTDDKDEQIAIPEEVDYINCFKASINAIIDNKKSVNDISEICDTYKIIDMIQDGLNE